MLEKIRDNSQGVIAKGILVLVICSFVFAGVSSYLGSQTDVLAAEVNGDKITQSELDQAYQNERARLKQQLGDMFDALTADDRYTNSIKQSVLDRLVADKLLDQAAVDMGLTISDDQIKAAILAEPAFQTDGRFDNDRYRALLRQLGYQPQTFKNLMQVDMTRRQLMSALIGTDFVLPNEALQLAELQGQTRDVSYRVIDTAPFLSAVSVTDEQVQDYYNVNQDQFMSPEMISLEYVELNAADFVQKAAVTDADAKTYYKDNQAQYLSAESRLAAHILVAFNGDEAQANAKARSLLTQLNEGADFAELAKSNSDDTLSAEQGGKLDWFEAGVMEPAFNNALFALNKGEYSELVQTDFGYHIIKLLDVKPSVTIPFADVKADIIAQMARKQAVEHFYSLQTILADTSYEVPDTLAETAKALGVTVQSTPLFSRDNAPAPVNDPQVIQAAFSDAVLIEGLNSDVFDLGDDHVIVVRVKQHQDAGPLALTDVKTEIIEHLQTQQATDLARANAQELLEQVQAGKAELALVTKDKLTRSASDVDSAIVAKAFQMPVPSDVPIVDTVSVANGYAVVVLHKVNAAQQVSDTVVNGLKQRLQTQYSESAYRGLIESLKATADITYPTES